MIIWELLSLCQKKSCKPLEIFIEFPQELYTQPALKTLSHSSNFLFLCMCAFGLKGMLCFLPKWSCLSTPQKPLNCLTDGTSR